MGIDARGLAGVLEILWDPNKVSLSGFNGNHRFNLVEFGVISFQLLES